MPFGSNEFRWLHGGFNHLSTLTYPASLGLSEADADSPTAVMRQGKHVAFADNKDDELQFATTSKFLGIMMDKVNLSGTTDATGFRDFVMEKHDIPKKRGSKVLVRQPLPGSMAEIEDADSQTAGIDRLLVTSGTGAISAATAIETELSCEAGGLRVAQSGDTVVARVKRANLTPKTAGQIRIRVQYQSPYIKA